MFKKTASQEIFETLYPNFSTPAQQDRFKKVVLALDLLKEASQLLEDVDTECSSKVIDLIEDISK